MAYTINELLGSRDGQAGDNDAYAYRYMVVGSDPETDTEAGAFAAAYAAAPATLNGLPKVGGSFESLGGLLWLVEVQYRPGSMRITAPPAAGSPNRESFSTTGGVQNIKRSLATIWGDVSPSWGLDVFDFGGLINVTDDSVEGVDIVVPAHNETVTRYLDDASVTPTFRKNIRDLTGCVNDDDFRGYAAGEVLFLGATGERREADGVWEITYHFDIRPNKEDIEVQDFEPFDQLGHEYVWFRTAPTSDPSGLARLPSHVYVEQVYPMADFDELGL